MRQIKFRVWTGIQMEYKIVAGFLGAFYVQGMDEKDAACLSPFNTIYPKEAPVMQFTGLTDKHGKEIYEGDIVKDEATIFEIIWVKGRFDFKRVSGAHQFPYFGDNCKRMEIIGNIHEQPYLLNPNN